MPKRRKLQEVNRRARHVTDRWIIVYEPWFDRQDHFKPILGLADIEEIVSWLCVLFRCERRQVHTAQHQTNRRFVIVKLDLSVDVSSKLGQYSWSDFLRWPAAAQQGKYSKIFEYDYVAHGDQSEKQWKEVYPASHPEGWEMNCPIIQSPPGPVWCERPKDLGGWALPLTNPPAYQAEENTNLAPIKVEDGYEEVDVKVEDKYEGLDVTVENGCEESEVKVEDEYSVGSRDRPMHTLVKNEEEEVDLKAMVQHLDMPHASDAKSVGCGSIRTGRPRKRVKLEQ